MIFNYYVLFIISIYTCFFLTAYCYCVTYLDLTVVLFCCCAVVCFELWLSFSFLLFCVMVVVRCCPEGLKWGPKSRKNGPRVWAFCKIEFPGIQKPVQIFDRK